MIRASTRSPRRTEAALASAATHGGPSRPYVAEPWQKSLELGLLLLGVVVAAGVIWGIVRLAFPRGEALGELRASAAPVVDAGLPRRSPSVPNAATIPVPRFEGTIARIRRSVQVRSGGELAWSGAKVGRAVHAHDAIQTLSEASAVVTVKDQGDIDIGENSLVVFEASSSDDFLATGTAVASVTHGALTGRLKADADRDVLGIRLPNAVVRVQGTRPGQVADFTLRVDTDRSASIVILRGRADVRARSGVHRLGSGEGIRISAAGTHAKVQSIPAVPTLLAPDAGQIIVYHKTRPRVSFRWQSPVPVDDYRFMLARDRDFREMLVDQRLTESSYVHAGLGTGDYYWRVSARRGWLESPSTGAAEVHLERDIDAAVREALTDLYEHSGTAKVLVNRARGILVFPRVVKGGIVIGGEYGEGALLSGGRTVDYYTLKSASLGLQMGGQTRRVALLFMTPKVYDEFVRSSGWQVGVDGSVAVAAISAGKGIDTSTARNPIIGFVFSNKGLMYNLTLEGSKISRMRD